MRFSGKNKEAPPSDAVFWFFIGTTTQGHVRSSSDLQLFNQEACRPPVQETAATGSTTQHNTNEVDCEVIDILMHLQGICVRVVTLRPVAQPDPGPGRDRGLSSALHPLPPNTDTHTQSGAPHL